jgi:hypothetical protein
MSPIKTDKARQVLLSRDRELGPRERQILILANGVRTRADLAELMGEAVHASIESLMRRGYLYDTSSVKAARVGVVSVKQSATSAQGAPSQADQGSVRVTASQAKRSLAATKMYVMDMLQMMRDMDASALAASLQMCTSERELMDLVMAAVQFIRARSGAGYALRVGSRLKDIVPEGHLPDLQRLLMQWEGEALTAA